MTNASQLPSCSRDSAASSSLKLAHRSGDSMTPSSETRVDSISLRIVVPFLEWLSKAVMRALPHRAEAGGGEQVRVAVIGGAGGNVDDRGAHLLRGERRAEAVEEGGDIDALPGGVGGYSGRAQVCFRSELRQHRGEPDAERVPAGFRGGIGRDEPDGGLGSGVAAAEWRAVDRGSAGEGDDRAARLQGKQQRLAGPVEHVLHVDFPVAAEGLPGLPVDR